jgi:hypothetical protein
MPAIRRAGVLHDLLTAGRGVDGSLAINTATSRPPQLATSFISQWADRETGLAPRWGRFFFGEGQARTHLLKPRAIWHRRKLPYALRELCRASAARS